MPFTTNANKNVIHYQWEDGGHDRTVVLINSLGTHLGIWDPVAARLGRQLNVLRFDKRGHGLSSTSEGAVSTDDYADDVIHLMDLLGIARADVAGLSIGGLIAYSLAGRYPDRMGKLIFSNTGARIGTRQSWDERLAALADKGLCEMAEGIVERWLSPAFRKAQPDDTAGMVTMLRRNSELGYRQACEAIRDADYAAVQAKQQIALYIGGSEDVGTTAHFVAEQASLQGADAKILEGVGHLPCVEAPEAVARIIAGFLLDTGADSLYERGMRTRRAVLGDDHVDRSEANKTEFDADFQEYIVNSAWGSIWSRPGLSKRERSLITLSLLAALGHDEELAMHIRACENTGASADDIKEALLHTGIYAGVPVTNHAMKIAKGILGKPNKNNG